MLKKKEITIERVTDNHRKLTVILRDEAYANRMIDLATLLARTYEDLIRTNCELKKLKRYIKYFFIPSAIITFISYIS